MTPFRKSALVMAMAATALQAQAALVTVNATGTPAGYLGAGAHNGMFDVTGTLRGSFTINRASFSFSFMDDGSDPLTAGPAVSTGMSISNYKDTGSSYYPFYRGDYYYSYTRSVTEHRSLNEAYEGESANLTLGASGTGVGSGVTASTLVSESFTTTYTGQTLDGQYGYSGYSYSCGNRSSCWSSGSWSSYYSDHYDDLIVRTYQQTGGFDITGTIDDPLLLGEILSSRMLSFELDIGGDLLMTAASLSLDFTDTTPLQATQAVPEPASMALVGGALGVLGLARRRSARDKRPPNA